MTEKARITLILIGSLEVEGIMLPDNSFGILVSQIAKLFSIPQKNRSITIKSLLNRSSRFLTTKVYSHPVKKEMSYVSLVEFEVLIAKLDRAGNIEAQNFSNDLVGVLLEKLWSEAFGVEFKKRKFQKKLKFKKQHKKQFHTKLTKWFRVDGKKSGKDYAIAVNRFKACMGLPLKPIKQYSAEELQKLSELEIEYNILRKSGKKHREAIAIMG